MPPIDGGNCSLDPGGTPCSQCVIAACCSETETCLNDFTCATDMQSFTNCLNNGTPPATCKTQSCGNNANCSGWTQCVIDNCAATCF